MAIRKKTGPVSGLRESENSCAQTSLKPQNLNKKRDGLLLTVPYANEHLTKKESLATNLELNSADHRTYFDPMGVQQWMTNSGLELDVLSEMSSYGPYNAAHGSDASVAPLAQGLQGSLSVLPPVTSPISLQESTCFPGPGRLPASYDDTCEPILASGIDPSFEFPGALTLNNVQTMGEQYHATWSHQPPMDDGFLYSNLPTAQSTKFIDEPGLFLEWTSEPFNAGADFFPGTGPCDSQPMAWPPMPGEDSSAASSYSHNSLPGHLSSSPLSPDVQEDAAQRASSDDAVGKYPVLSIGEALPFSLSVDGAASLIDMSTLKPRRDLQRTQISTVDSWSPCDISNSHTYVAPPLIARRRSSEGETTTAREHRYYQVGPGADGLYHCPFAATEDCTHKPEKLKCNYDKHLDSHLKPYRCKVSSCVAVPFSSTACLLRHEREAHGMHGHGEKPHLCYFADCERSQPGNGFPRRWNLGDHMKRMHDYTGPAYSTGNSTGSSSPTPSSTSSFYQGIPSKRRPSNASQNESTKRTKPSASMKTQSKAAKPIAPSTSQRKQRQSMDKMFHEKKAAIAAGLENLDPKDIRATAQITADYAVLQTIGMTIRRQEASEFAL